MNKGISKLGKDIAKRLEKISKLHKEIQLLRQACPHEDIKATYKCDTGNYCHSDDCYWIEAECLDCGERFNADSVDQPELYRKLSVYARAQRSW